MKIWSTTLYSAATSRDITQGTAYFAMSFPTGSVSKNTFDFSSIGNNLQKIQKKRAVLRWIYVRKDYTHLSAI